MLTLIDWLLDNTDCYYIDFLPETMVSSDYFEIEEFFYDTYIKDFSKKIRGKTSGENSLEKRQMPNFKQGGFCAQK